MRVVTLRLDIDGQAYFCKTYQNESIQISRRVTDLENFSSQRTITEKTFRVPLTDELIDALGLVSDFTQDAKVNLNKAIEGQVLVNDYPYFTGSFQVFAVYTNLRETLKEVELVFKGNEVSLKQSLEELTMADILEGETVPYTIAEYKSFLNTGSTYVNNSGVFWPLIDYGQRFTTDTSATSGTIIGNGQTAITQLDLKPAVTFKKLFELMPFEITWDSSINDLVENQGILLHNNESRLANIDTSPRDYTGYMTNDAKTLTLNSSSSGSVVNSPLIFDNKVVYNQDNFNLATSQYETPVSGDYIIRVKANVTLTRKIGTTSNRWTVRFWVLNTDAGNVQYLTLRTVFLNAVGDSQNIAFDITYTQPDTYRTNNMQVQIQVINSSSEQIDITFPQDEFKFEVVQTPGINNTSNIVLSDNAPELNGWEIFSTIAKQCNAIIEQNDLGTYNIIPWQKWIDNLDVNRFLDDKIDDSKTIKITPFSIKGAKSIELSYLANDDLYSQAFLNNQGVANGTFIIRDTGTDATKKKLKVELPVSLPPLSYLDGSGFPIMKLYDDNFETIKGKPVVTFYNTFWGFNFPFDLEDAANDTIPTQQRQFIYYTGYWSISSGVIGGYGEKDYSFGTNLAYFAAQGYPNNTLHERFWKQYIQETYSENARQVEMAIDDNIISVEETKFNERYYFKGSQFRLTEFDNYTLTSSEPFKIKLMKRITIENIDIAPFYPYNVIDGVVQWKDSATNLALSPPDGSGANQTDLEASAKAYGFFYDPVQDVAIQRGGILTL